MVLDHEFDHDVESSSSDEEENESLKAMKERLLRSKKNRPKSPTPSADFREGDTVSVLYENKRYHAVIIQIRPTRIKVRYTVDKTLEFIHNGEIQSRQVRLVRRKGEEEDRPKITPHVGKRSRSTLRKQKYTLSEKKIKASPKRRRNVRIRTSPYRKSPQKKKMKRSILNDESIVESQESDIEPVEFEAPPSWLLGE